MKRTIINFIVSSLLKGLLLFLIILTGDFVESIPVLLRFLVYFIIIGLLDWQMLKRIKNEKTGHQFIKALSFSYFSFAAILWITGPLFQLYNYLTKTIVEGKTEMPIAGLIMFLTFGLITSLVSSYTWINKNKKTAANRLRKHDWSSGV